MGKKICIVAFSDSEGNSLAYKKFDDIEKAIEFYRKQLEKDDVNVISTRKTIPKEERKIRC
jgi:CRISPR/Cas system-associated endonuclease/helicase Cas3